MDINDTIQAFKCCIKIPPDCGNCPQQGPGFGIVCKQAVKDSVSYWLYEAKKAAEGGEADSAPLSPDRSRMITVLDTLSRFLSNYDSDFFANAVNKESYAEHLKEIANYIKERD